MFTRPRRGALGLRGRIVGAVLITTVTTLVVAAVALLGPLEHSLRHAAQNTLAKDLGNHPTAKLTKLDLGATAFVGFEQGKALKDPNSVAKLGPLFRNAPENGLQAAKELKRLVAQIAASTGGSVDVYGYPNSEGIPSQSLSAVNHLVGDPLDDVAQLFRGRRPLTVRSIDTIDGKEYARDAELFTTRGGIRWVLAVRKPIDEIPGAVRAVRTAFIWAAGAGLALTMLLAIPLAGTVVRRLRRLRESALEIAREGLPVQVPEDRARDEVGDLARTFVIMQQRLRQQEEARRAFVATASHELRTPLTSLDGMLELLDDDLQSGDPDLDDARLLVERARAQSHRLGRLAADLLDLSRIDAEVKLRSEPVELGELCRAVLAEFEHASGSRGRGIGSALDDSAGAIWALGDPGSVARILRILLDNAVRVSAPGSEVTVELHGEPRPSLSVRDHGPGVEPSDRELIFERFHRGRATAGDAGFGLGLAIGRELAERMGGELALGPQNGPGATFTLTLPSARAPEEDPAVVV